MLPTGMMMFGIVLLTQIYDIGATSVTPIGVGAGLLAGLSYAVFIFGFKYAAPHGSPQAILSIAFAVLVIILIWPSDVDQTVVTIAFSALLRALLLRSRWTTRATIRPQATPSPRSGEAL